MSFMIYWVHKVDDPGSVDMLPFIADTSIWSDYDISRPTREIKLIAWLYDAVQKRENYYQENTPCAFGDPKFEYLAGIVHGILQAGEIIEENKGRYIEFRRGGRVILRVDKVEKPKSYYETAKENRELMSHFK